MADDGRMLHLFHEADDTTWKSRVLFKPVYIVLLESEGKKETLPKRRSVRDTYIHTKRQRDQKIDKKK